ncbi:hypothetical protein ACOSQ2_028288 [Xanthoceras sorbifolium]
MDGFDISNLCASLSLSENDGPIATLDLNLCRIGAHKLLSYLVGKVLSNRVINREAFRSILPKIWKTSQEVDIEVLNTNIFAFYFWNLSDRKRILAGGPWNFDKVLIVLEEPRGAGNIGDMLFKESELWVQVHNVPLVCMTREIGLFIGRQIGEVCDIDLGATGDCLRKFLRVQVKVDISKPL